MLRVSMSELSTLRWSFEEDAERFAGVGYDGIGVWRQKLSDVGVERGAELLLQHDIRCSNLLWAGGFTGSDGLSFRESVSDAVDAIRAAAAVQADCVVIYSGSWGGHTRSHARRLVANALRELLPFAEEFGVSLAIEPMHVGCAGGWTFLHSIEETLDLIDPMENPYLKITLDTYHCGFENLDLNRISEIAHRVGIVHLGDGRRAPAGEQDRCPLGQGCVPILTIIETLIRAGYDGFVDVELIGESVEQFDYTTLLNESIDYLGRMFAAM